MISPQTLATRLVTWSKNKINYGQAVTHARAYLEGTLSDGLIKDYFMSVHPIAISIECAIPTCKNKTETKFCTDCLNLTTSSEASKLLKVIGELLCLRP